MEMRKPLGYVVILNGVSSTGKTTLARAMQRVSNELIVHISLDDHLMALPCEWRSNAFLLASVVPMVVQNVFTSAAFYAQRGVNVVVDIVLQERKWVIDFIEILHECQVLCVGLFCPCDELERREKQRDAPTDRLSSQMNRVHEFMFYDHKFDTSKQSSDECAEEVLGLLKAGGDAFSRVKSTVVRP